MAKHFNYRVWNLIKVERDSAVPLYEQIFGQFRLGIHSGLVPSGTRLPPSRMLARELALARNMVIQAYDRLEAEGYVRRAPGSGTFVETVLPEDHQTQAGTPSPPALGDEPIVSDRAARLLAQVLPREVCC